MTVLVDGSVTFLYIFITALFNGIKATDYRPLLQYLFSDEIIMKIQL